MLKLVNISKRKLCNFIVTAKSHSCCLGLIKGRSATSKLSLTALNRNGFVEIILNDILTGKRITRTLIN